MSFRLSTGMPHGSHDQGVCIQKSLPPGGLPREEGGLHPGEESASRRAWADPPSPRETWDTTGYDQQAGGTHPTGKHSSINFLCSVQDVCL